MLCPACHDEMIVVEYQEIELDICMGCRGVWFDADELGLLLGTLSLSMDDLGRAAEGETTEVTRKCPYCGKAMEKVLMGPDEGVVIDKCRNGHGLWFDGGELDIVVAGLRKASAGEVGEVGSFLGDVLLTNEETNDDTKKGE